MSVILWYIASLFLGFIGFALTSRIIKFPDKGYAFARIAGLLLVSYLNWLFLLIFKTHITLTGSWASIIALTCIVAPYSLKVFKKFKTPEIKLVIFEEALFIATYAIFLLLRFAIPNIEDVEKFMDFGIINGLLRATSIPPLDVWYSGNSINYYYFGQFATSTLFRLSNVVAAVSYNIGVAYNAAVCITAAFSIIYYFTNSYLSSLMWSLVLIAGGNLDYMKNQLLVKKADYFFPDARSLMPYTINEFPIYSFLIGDLHAHILNISNVLLFIGSLLSTTSLSGAWILIIPFSSFGVTNSWDFLMYFPLILFYLLQLGAKKFDRTFLVKCLVVTCGIVIGSLLVFLPFYLKFKPAVFGIAIINPIIDFPAICIMFGLFIFSALPAYINLSLSSRNRAKESLAADLFSYALLLMLIPSFFVIKDIYSTANPEYFRANTVFKFWYQAWILFGISTPVLFHKTLELLHKRKVILFLYKSVVAIMLFFVLGYTTYSVRYLLGGSYHFVTQDGSAFLNRQLPEYKAFINYINTNEINQSVVLEKAGTSYTTDTVVASFTGLQSVIGWADHEVGWRNNWPDASIRITDISTMYTSSTPEEIAQLIKKYNIKYVVIGEKEYAEYGNDAGTTMKTMYKPSVTYGRSRLLVTE